MYGGVEGLDSLLDTLLPPRGIPGIAEYKMRLASSVGLRDMPVHLAERAMELSWLGALDWGDG